MRRTTLAPVATAVMAGMVLVAGCSDDEPPEENPTEEAQFETEETTETTSAEVETETTTATQEPAETQTATETAEPELTPEEQDEADAERAIVDLSAAVDAVGAGEEDLEHIYPMTGAEARDYWMRRLIGTQEQGFVHVGDVDVEVVSIEWTGDDEMVIRTCRDYSAKDVVDEDGVSVVGDGPARQAGTSVLHRGDPDHESTADYPWYVAEDEVGPSECDD